MSEQNSNVKKDQEPTQVFSSNEPQKESEKSKSDEQGLASNSQDANITKTTMAVGVTGAGIAGVTAGAAFAEEIREGVASAQAKMEGLFSGSEKEESSKPTVEEHSTSIGKPENQVASEIPEVKAEPASGHIHAISNAPTEMGISHTFEDGRVFQITFSDVDHDGKIDNWTASATDVTGNSQMVTGSGEQLTAIFLGQPSYAQQVDYIDEQTPIASMEENFAPIDWQSFADEPMAIIDAEMATEEEFQSQPMENGAINHETVGSDSANFIGPVYEEQIQDIEFDQMTVPESYPMDIFPTDDDFVTAQFM